MMMTPFCSQGAPNGRITLVRIKMNNLQIHCCDGWSALSADASLTEGHRYQDSSSAFLLYTELDRASRVFIEHIKPVKQGLRSFP
jgi:hypothetical protein